MLKFGIMSILLTAKQAVLATYIRGRAILESKLAPGSMAAIGLT